MENSRAKIDLTKMKENFLDSIIQQQLSWAVNRLKEQRRSPLKSSQGSNLKEAIKASLEAEEDAQIKQERLREEAEKAKRRAEERKEYLDNFEDTDITHTPEQRLATKKEKLFDFIERMKQELTEEEKNRIVDWKRCQDEQEQLQEEKKERKRPWIIFRKEKRRSVRCDSDQPAIKSKEHRVSPEKVRKAAQKK